MNNFKPGKYHYTYIIDRLKELEYNNNRGKNEQLNSSGMMTAMAVANITHTVPRMRSYRAHTQYQTQSMVQNVNLGGYVV